MPHSLWWDHLTPNASPIPLHPHHMLPTPTTFILAHVTSVLGTAEQSSRCHGSRWREPAHWLLAEKRKKRPAVSGVVCLVPACHCFQSAAGLATLTVRAAAGRGPRGPPATAVCTAGQNGGPRSMSLVSPSSVKCVKDKSRACKEKWAAVSFTLNSSELFSSVWIWNLVKWAFLLPAILIVRGPEPQSSCQHKTSIRFHFVDHYPVTLKRKEDSIPFQNGHPNLIVFKIIFLLLDSLLNLTVQLESRFWHQRPCSA